MLFAKGGRGNVRTKQRALVVSATSLPALEKQARRTHSCVIGKEIKTEGCTTRPSDMTIQNLLPKEIFPGLLVHVPIAKFCLATLVFVTFLGGSLSILAAAQEKTALTVTAVGDVRITGGVAKNSLDAIRKINLKGDLVFGNFEGVLAESVPPDPWKFSVPIESLGLLKDLGFNTVNLANNHSLDIGEQGYQKTRLLLAQQGFWVAGREGHGVVAQINGLRVRVIGFSFSSGNNVNNLADIPVVIGEKQKEIVIVSAHMGGENHLGHRIPREMEYFGDEKRGNVVEFSHRCIDAGADLVLGHGPHVPRGIELYKNKLIVYSLGNFLFDYPGVEMNPHAPGYSISIDLDNKGDFRSARIESYDLQYGIPVLDKRGHAYKMIQNLTFQTFQQHSLVFPGNGVVQKSDPRRVTEEQR